MNQFFPGFEEFKAEQEQQSEAAYDARMLKRLLARVMDSSSAVAELVREAGDEFGFTWLNENYSPPVHITAAKLNCPLVDLLAKSLMRKPVGKAYLEARESCNPDQAVGVVFPISGHSNWIIHDALMVRLSPGVTYVSRGGHDGTMITITTFDDFADGMKLSWQP
jgi:hypothetical protein